MMIKQILILLAVFTSALWNISSMLKHSDILISCVLMWPLAFPSKHACNSIPCERSSDLTTSLHMFPLALTDYKWNVRECKLCISSTRLSSQLLQVLSQFCDKIAQVGCIWL
jgi:hypothetical protein